MGMGRIILLALLLSGCTIKRSYVELDIGDIMKSGCKMTIDNPIITIECPGGGGR